MTTPQRTIITVETSINAPVEKVWAYWTQPEHIKQWSFASDEWHTPRAENDLRKGGTFSSRMEAKDGSMGFDFAGVYDEVKPHEYIEYSLGDGRKVTIHFSAQGNRTKVTESFDAEDTNPVDMQKMGWQSILDNFKKYTESGK